jgi:hypothetical protein
VNRLSPVLTELEGRRDVSQNALALYGPEPGDFTVELVQARFSAFANSSSNACSYLGVLVLGGRPQSINLVLVVVDHGSLAADPAHDGLESGLVCVATGVGDLETRHAVILAVVEIVRMFAGQESNVPGRKEEDLIAFAEIETTSAFEGKTLRAIWRPRAGVNGLRTSAVG